MNFEVFEKESELNERVDEIRKEGITNISHSFNGSTWVLKWRK